MAICGPFAEAQLRTRTGDPFLTMEVWGLRSGLGYKPNCLQTGAFDTTGDNTETLKTTSRCVMEVSWDHGLHVRLQ
jgi:hypothetical protein